jgi:hypothetical protein
MWWKRECQENMGVVPTFFPGCQHRGDRHPLAGRAAKGRGDGTGDEPSTGYCPWGSEMDKRGKNKARQIFPNRSTVHSDEKGRQVNAESLSS